MKKLSVILAVLLLGTSLMAFSGCSGNTEETKEQGKTESAQNGESGSSEKEPDPNYKKLYLETAAELDGRYDDVTWTYSIFDIDGDATPELVAEYPCHVSLFTVFDGKVYTVMEEMRYGYSDNDGYMYLPGKNVMYNKLYEMAGAVVYETFYKIGNSHYLENVYAKPLYTSSWIDENSDGMPDESEVGKELKYFYGTEELTKEEYESYRFGDDFLPLKGEMGFDELAALLAE